jgi:hypothetical protein
MAPTDLSNQYGGNIIDRNPNNKPKIEGTRESQRI